MNMIRDEYVRQTEDVRRFGEKTQEARLRYVLPARTKDDGYIGRRMPMMELELPGKRKTLKA